MPQIYAGRLLLIGLFGGLIGLASVYMSDLSGSATDMVITPQHGSVVLGETFTVAITVTSKQPVNVFSGELVFNPQQLRVSSIDYNTSIADLWAERPWYQNGAGTLNFIGGTTRNGGFTGTGSLITVTFESLAVGNAAISMRDIRILAHDGLGSDTMVNSPIDSIFTVAPEIIQTETVLEKSSLGGSVSVVLDQPDTDLNSDGKQNIADMSIFMKHLATNNLRSDFNGDGKVSMADASILLNAK